MTYKELLLEMRRKSEIQAEIDKLLNNVNESELIASITVLVRAAKMTHDTMLEHGFRPEAAEKVAVEYILEHLTQGIRR